MPGLTLHGCLYELRTSAPLMAASGGSVSDGDDEEAWPTPMAADADKHSPATRLGASGSHTPVSATLQSWPTPRAADGAHMPATAGECTARRLANGQANLGEAVQETALWATPMAHDTAPGNPQRVGRFGTAFGGKNLNDEAALWATPKAQTSEVEARTRTSTPNL